MNVGDLSFELISALNVDARPDSVDRHPTKLAVDVRNTFSEADVLARPIVYRKQHLFPSPIGLSVAEKTVGSAVSGRLKIEVVCRRSFLINEADHLEQAEEAKTPQKIRKSVV